MIVHAGLVALREAGLWRGCLITGPSGSGKSDLALRCLEAGFRLVADDRVVLWTSAGQLFGKAPERLFGLIEARGLGVMTEPALPFAPVRLVAAAATDPERIPPEGERDSLLGHSIAKVSLDFLQLSAPAKLRRALLHLG
ncbi:MAG: serine kinase [Caulobacteraceae bacterium]|nr:serine kinase [Caulobacteraceae bacterium]